MNNNNNISNQSYNINDIFDFDGIIKEFSVIAELKKNERLYQDFKAHGAIVGKYEDPATASWVWTQGRRWVQAYNRNSNGDSTEKACERIQKISNVVLELLDKPFKSKFEFYNDFSCRLKKYQDLYDQIENCAGNGKGFDALKKTVESCEANATFRSADSTNDKSRMVDEAISAVKRVSTALEEKIHEYLQIQTGSLLDNKNSKEHLESVLEMILNPADSFDTRTTNINRCQVLSVDDVTAVLKESFGEDVVNDIIHIYKLDTKIVFDYNDFYALTIGIVSNLSYQDVLAIVKNKQGKAYEKLEKKLGAEALLLSEDRGSIEEKTLFKILNVLRDVDIIDVGCSSSFRDKPYACHQLAIDLSSIESCNIVSEYRSHKSNFKNACKVQTLKEKFGYIEHLARDHAYSRFFDKDYQFRDGVVFPQYDENGNKVCREACKVFAKDAIFVLGVRPIQGVSAERNKVQIVFRGTADIESVMRDLQDPRNFYNGPGLAEFEANEKGIIENVEKFTRSLAIDNVTLEISGHSLGATDAMRMAKLWLEHAAQKIENSEAYSKVKKFNLVTFNGPGYYIPYRDIFYNSVVKLSRVVEVDVTLFTTHLDQVHKFGTFYAGQIEEGKEKPINLNRKWIQFNFTDGLTQGDSLAHVYNNGSVAAAGDLGYRKYTAHSHSYFKEHKRGTTNQIAPVEVRYFSMDQDQDKQLIHEDFKNNEVSVADIDKVFSTNFSYSKYFNLNSKAKD